MVNEIITITIIRRVAKLCPMHMDVHQNLKSSNLLLRDRLQKKKSSNFTMEKPGRHYFNQVIKVNLTNNKAY